MNFFIFCVYRNIYIRYNSSARREWGSHFVIIEETTYVSICNNNDNDASLYSYEIFPMSISISNSRLIVMH
jgi:hypothetical protein